MSIAENTIKETKEEAGLNVTADRLIAVQDRKKHNEPPYVYGVIKTFTICTAIDGEFQENSETTERRYFLKSELPENLSEEKVNKEQILMCFEAKDDENWEVRFD